MATREVLKTGETCCVCGEGHRLLVIDYDYVYKSNVQRYPGGYEKRFPEVTVKEHRLHGCDNCKTYYLNAKLARFNKEQYDLALGLYGPPDPRPHIFRMIANLYEQNT